MKDAAMQLSISHRPQLQVVGSSTMEVTLAQFWSSLGASSVDVEVSFHGVECSPASLHLDGSAGVVKFYLRYALTSPLDMEERGLHLSHIIHRWQSEELHSAVPKGSHISHE